MQIIRELQRDGRRPYTSIAKTIGLSEAAVRQRVQRLLDAGVMQIVAVTDPLQVGFHRQAMVGVKVDGDVRELATRRSTTSSSVRAPTTSSSSSLRATTNTCSK